MRDTFKPITWQHGFGVLGLVLIVAGSAHGLFSAPPERHMGEVSRILFVHIPTAWISLVAYTACFFLAVLTLWTGKPRFDAAQVGALEVGAFLNVLLLASGMIFAKPTWGIWWDWDVRLTTSLLALLLFTGVLGLRAFIDEPQRRATWTAVATIIAYVDVPIVYYCVRWWRSLHQIQSSPETVDEGMHLALRLNAFGVLFLAIWFMVLRSRIERLRALQEQVPAPAPVVEMSRLPGEV